MPDPPFLTFKAVNRSPRVPPKTGKPIPDYLSPSRSDQAKRLLPKFGKLEEALAHKSFQLHVDAPGYLAEEILVLEIAGGLEDFLETLREVEGFEWLGDEQVDFTPDEDGFRKRDPRKQSESVGGLLYLFATNLPALQQLKSAWKQKADGEGLSGITSKLGKMARIYDGHAPSAWARMIDWLQWKYQVLFIISAGNCSRIPVEMSLSELEKLSPEELEKAFVAFRIAEARQLRLLSPAESINAITVGSHHSDETGPVNLSSIQLMPIRHPDMPSPSSRNGPGFLRSVKPDILMPGGRQPISVIGDKANCYLGHLAPGQKVAAPPSPGQPGPATKFIRGTSGATALATRQAAILIEQLSEMATPPPPSHMAVIVKTLLTHGASWNDADTHLRSMFGSPGSKHIKWKGGTVSPLVGHGRINEKLLNSIEGHRATVLGWDTISEDESLEFRFPIPASLGTAKGKKRFTVTLAYLSPINPHNRKYRTARLSFKFPELINAFLSKKGRRNVDDKQGCKGTIQHEIYEDETLRGIVDGEFIINVECREEGGLMDTPVPFALAVTLEGAPEIFPNIRPEITEHLRNITAVPLSSGRVPV